jgi:tetratricopeptide (TPR) repeat protein
MKMEKNSDKVFLKNSPGLLKPLIGFFILFIFIRALSAQEKSKPSFQRAMPDEQLLKTVKPIIEEQYFKRSADTRLEKKNLSSQAFAPVPLPRALLDNLLKREGGQKITERDAGKKEIQKELATVDKIEKITETEEQKRIKQIFTKTFPGIKKPQIEIIEPQWKKEKAKTLHKDKSARAMDKISFTQKQNEATNLKKIEKEPLFKLMKKEVLVPQSNAAENKKISNADAKTSLEKQKEKDSLATGDPSGISTSESRQENSRTLARDLFELNSRGSRLLDRSQDLFKEEGKQVENSRMFEIQAAFKNGKYLEAIQLADAIKKESPLHPRAIFHRSEAYEYLQEYEKSIESYLELVRQFPAHSLADDALKAAARLYRKLGNDTASIVLLGEILKSYPAGNQVDDALYNLGKIYQTSHHRQDLRMAKKFFAALIRKFGNENSGEGSPYLAASKLSLKNLRNSGLN